MSIAWNDSFAIGDEDIDSDHRAMMALIGRLEILAAAPPDCREVGALLVELRDQCRDHFAREEDLQRRIGFPDAESHRLGHQLLLQRLDSVINHYAGGCDQIRSGILRTLGDSLATWLVFHITRSDSEMKPYVAAVARRRRAARRFAAAAPPPGT